MTIRRHISKDGTRRTGFTIIEMIIVMAIVLVLAGLVLPGVNSMWAERRIADTQTLVQGMLQTSRSRAMRAGGTESGLFFFLDDSGTQRIVSIEKDTTHSGEVAWESVFLVNGKRQYKLPRPMRVVPRYVVDTGTNPLLVFGDEEIVNEQFATLGSNVDNAQRHRNFFTMLFTSEGQLVVRRDILLWDVDSNPVGSSRRGTGDFTGLPVPAADPPAVTSYFAQDNTPTTNEDDPDTGGTAVLPHMIFDKDAGDVAMNFPTVDGLLAYDNDAFSELETAAAKRTYLLESAQPFYVNRYTGAVVRGPVGEN